jgi:succinate dehydrogenase/fumarate reductase-like Fe-S protein
MVISRSFNLQFDEGDNKKFGNYPFRIILKEGPGEQTATGAIKPLGQATSSVDIRVPIDTFYTSMLELQDWLRARQGEIERQRWEAQVQKFQRKQAERVG